MKKSITGVILAGGLNTRFNGENKAFIRLDGQTIIERLYRLFRNLFDEIIIVTNSPVLFSGFDCLVAADLFSFRASLTGIHTGLFYATRDHIFVCACDTPFVKAALIETVLEASHPSGGASIPATSAGLEPLCAVYAKKSLPLVERHVARSQMKIQRVFGKKRIHEISEKKLRRVDPDLVSFFNINRPEDLDLAKRMVAKIPAFQLGRCP
ncbi:MAG: molybdenum cofactor guanylyltransferase [Thermodesulfobacteriota bacterium]|nr:molybdenum cofactor guanylyltransferase [Thermodesulfobacteriota bacterium]